MSLVQPLLDAAARDVEVGAEGDARVLALDRTIAENRVKLAAPISKVPRALFLALLLVDFLAAAVLVFVLELGRTGGISGIADALNPTDANAPSDSDITHYYLYYSLFDVQIVYLFRTALMLPLAMSIHRFGDLGLLPTKCTPKESAVSTLAWHAAAWSAVLCGIKGVLLASDDAKAWHNPFRAAAVVIMTVIPLAIAVILHYESNVRAKRVKVSAALDDQVEKRGMVLAELAGLSAEERRKSREEEEDEDDEQPSLNWKTFTAMANFFRPYFVPKGAANFLRALMTYTLMILQQAAGVLAPLYIGQAAQGLSDGDTLGEILKYISLYAGLNLLSQCFKEAQNCIYQHVKAEAYKQINSSVFRHLLSLSIEWHHKKKLGVVQRVIDRGITSADSVVKYLILYLMPYIGQIIVVTILFVVKFNVPTLAAILFMGMLVYIVVTIQLTIWRKEIRKRMNKSDNKLHDILTDSLMNVETVKYFASEEREYERYLKEVARYQTGATATQYSLSVLNIAQQMSKWGTLFLLLLVTCMEIRAHDHGFRVGDFVTILTYGNQLFSPLGFLGTIYGMLVQSVVDLMNIVDLLVQKPEVVDAKDAYKLQIGDDSMRLANPSDPTDPGRRRDCPEIKFSNVVFRYPSSLHDQTKGIKGISFRVAPGTTTAIVGATGSGKTTIGRLLFRFYDIQEGTIEVGGQPISGVTRASLRNAIGVVPQDNTMFNKSIRYNIEYGCEGTVDEEKLREACRNAQILDFIEEAPKGWDTKVGERGLKLSGGEKQRVAIARALLKDPPVVILDEATSALDTVTERAVQKALSALERGRTCIVIAHRLSTVRNADQIIVLDDGIIVERGTHDELMSAGAGGAYRRLVAEIEDADDVEEGGAAQY